MKALLLNSGMGTRMGELTSDHPKCMTELTDGETIISRQLEMLHRAGISNIVITTGYRSDILMEYCNKLGYGESISFVENKQYENTNYIYSIYCAKDELVDDILLMHGDLVFEYEVLEKVIQSQDSCMVVSSACLLPQKDFKAVIENDRIKAIGTNFFENAISAQPLYKIQRKDWMIWLDKITEFCNNGTTDCYAENAFNEVSDLCVIKPLDVENGFCKEIDNGDDLKYVIERI